MADCQTNSDLPFLQRCFTDSGHSLRQNVNGQREQSARRWFGASHKALRVADYNALPSLASDMPPYIAGNLTCPNSYIGKESLRSEIYVLHAQPSMFGFSDSCVPSSPPNPLKLILKPEECQSFTLPDMHILGFATYGSTTPSDPVVFLFHGLPGCRIVGRSWDSLCKKIGARLITIDRPGCGLSTLADRGLTDWPEDVLGLADHLGIACFSILGASGGGPFALACTRFIPQERLRGTAVVCGIGPMEAVLDTMPYLSWRLMGITPWILQIMARNIFLPSLVHPYCTKDPSRLKRVLEDQHRTSEEKALLSDDNNSDTNLDDVVAGLLETFSPGTDGCMQDGNVLSGDWGFDLKEVDSDKVWLVHGDRDTHAPLKMAQWIDDRLGEGRLRVLEGKTHFTIWRDHSEEISRQLAEA